MQVYLLVGAIVAIIAIFYLSAQIYANKLLVKIEFLVHENNRLLQQINELQITVHALIEEKFNAEKEKALALQKYQSVLDQMQEFEKLKMHSIETAKAAIFDVGNKLSTQLIAEHKRESDLQKEESQKHFKTTTENLYQDFTKLTEVITNLREQVTTSQSTTDMVYKALLAPNTVGNLAEITLENILKSSNLVANIDYQMQYSINDQDNNRLRPDAVIFLPGNNIMVVDSKASKFFLELGQAQTKHEEQAIKLKLKNTMRTHLKSLFSKDYRQAMVSHLKNKNINHISTIMFLPTETCLEIMQEIDNQLLADAWQNNIYPAGPMGLINILSHAKFQISEERKNQNYSVIIEEVSALLYNISNLAVHAKKLGSSIYNSIGFFDKFAASFNSSFIARAKRIEKLGVSVKTNKQTPEMIERYQVISGSKLTTIENQDEKLLEDNQEEPNE